MSKRKAAPVLGLISLMLALGLTACGSKFCKEVGCEEEVYKRGYCAIHFAEHYPEAAWKDIQDAFEKLDQLDPSELWD